MYLNLNLSQDIVPLINNSFDAFIPSSAHYTCHSSVAALGERKAYVLSTGTRHAFILESIIHSSQC